MRRDFCFAPMVAPMVAMVVALSFAGPGRGWAADRVTLGLDWKAEAEYGG